MRVCSTSVLVYIITMLNFSYDAYAKIDDLVSKYKPELKTKIEQEPIKVPKWPYIDEAYPEEVNISFTNETGYEIINNTNVPNVDIIYVNSDAINGTLYIHNVGNKTIISNEMILKNSTTTSEQPPRTAEIHSSEFVTIHDFTKRPLTSTIIPYVIDSHNLSYEGVAVTIDQGQINPSSKVAVNLGSELIVPRHDLVKDELINALKEDQDLVSSAEEGTTISKTPNYIHKKTTTSDEQDDLHTASNYSGNHSGRLLSDVASRQVEVIIPSDYTIINGSEGTTGRISPTNHDLDPEMRVFPVTGSSLAQELDVTDEFESRSIKKSANSRRRVGKHKVARSRMTKNKKGIKKKNEKGKNETAGSGTDNKRRGINIAYLDRWSKDKHKKRKRRIRIPFRGNDLTLDKILDIQTMSPNRIHVLSNWSYDVPIDIHLSDINAKILKRARGGVHMKKLDQKLIDLQEQAVKPARPSSANTVEMAPEPTTVPFTLPLKTSVEAEPTGPHTTKAEASSAEVTAAVIPTSPAVETPPAAEAETTASGEMSWGTPANPEAVPSSEASAEEAESEAEGNTKIERNVPTEGAEESTGTEAEATEETGNTATTVKKRRKFAKKCRAKNQSKRKYCKKRSRHKKKRVLGRISQEKAQKRRDEFSEKKPDEKKNDVERRIEDPVSEIDINEKNGTTNI